MANRLTQVPDRPVPLLPGWARPVVRVADLFMLAMVSRPRSGSLRHTWVTPATLALCTGLGAVGLAVGAVMTAVGQLRGDRPEAYGGIGILVLALGAAAVAAVGLVQRRGPASSDQVPPPSG